MFQEKSGSLQVGEASYVAKGSVFMKKREQKTYMLQCKISRTVEYDLICFGVVIRSSRRFVNISVDILK